ncbi:MAG: DALR anticodon-binding domain-containing protein, partial [Nanoarchaeota archaeon]
LKEKDEIKNARLVLVDCVRHVLKNSLNLLGIGVLERM